MDGLNKSCLMILLHFLPRTWKRAEAKATYASTNAHYASAIYFANAINGQPTAANDASLYTESATVSEAAASATPDRLQWGQGIQSDTLAINMK